MVKISQQHRCDLPTLAVCSSELLLSFQRRCNEKANPARNCSERRAIDPARPSASACTLALCGTDRGVRFTAVLIRAHTVVPVGTRRCSTSTSGSKLVFSLTLLLLRRRRRRRLLRLLQSLS
eukprot:382259-Rhodomonas_salina.2